MKIQPKARGQRSWSGALLCFATMLLVCFEIKGFAVDSPPLSADGNPSSSTAVVASSNSIVEILQRLLQVHQRFRELRLERSTLQAEIEKLQAETDDLTARVQGTPAVTPKGESNPKRESLERKLTSVQTRISASNQKLSKVEDAMEELGGERNSMLLALVRRIFFFLIFAFLIWILARLLRRIPGRIVKEEQDRFYINKLITYTGRLVVTIIFLYTIFGEFGSFSALLGLTGAGVAIALQDVIVSFVAWFFIIGRRGLTIGDRIEVSGVRGDVVDIGVLRIVVHEVGNWISNDVPTGRRVFIPNSFVFKNYFFNYTKPQPFVNDELKLTFTFETDWQEAVDQVLATARNVMNEFFRGEQEGTELIPQDESFTHWANDVNPSMPAVYTGIAESGVEVRLVYYTRVRERNKMRDAMNRAILKALAEHPGLTLAYPTSRAIPTPPGVKP
ncbi:MAG: mechanosensitive ion channel [Acidobacteriia bacterium]|nr:mechanosensitive ion channel [Terriglobia bacterium]